MQKVSSDVDFFDLTAFTVEPYVPSLDENGVPYLKGADLANAEINHYRKQYEKAPTVRAIDGPLRVINSYCP